MVEPINLNKARKARDKARAKAEAAANRASHGRTRQEKAAEALKAEAAARLLDGARRERLTPPDAGEDS
jgi:hypothetical protein